MAEQKNKKVEEQIDNTPIDGQMEIAPEDTEDKNIDYIKKQKVIDIVNSVVAKYDGKVVLAMSEVRDIIKAITTAVNE